MYNPLVNSVGIEFNEARITISNLTSATLQENNNLVRSFSPPLFIHGDITDRDTMVGHLTDPNLNFFSTISMV